MIKAREEHRKKKGIKMSKTNQKYVKKKKKKSKTSLSEQHKLLQPKHIKE